jgi:hypothetical protein
MFGGDEAETETLPEPRDRFSAHSPARAPAAGAGLPAMVKIFVVPLGAAAVLKLWLITQYIHQLQVAVDQAAQLVVIVCLIVICSSAGGGKR